MNTGALWRVRQWFPNYSEEVYERLRIYHLELLRWTSKINLISPATSSTADRVHFADSILGVELCQKKLGATTETIWDLGSGNGFPGLIWAILYPTQNYILIDSDERKIGFIKNMSARLQLDCVAARHTRIEDIVQNTIHVGVCRGLTQIQNILIKHGKTIAPGGSFFHFKGPDWQSEIKAIPEALCSTWNTQLVNQYKLPPEDEAKPVSEVRSIVLSSKKS